MSMFKKTAMVALVAGLAMPAMAQDSVSSNGTGDALSPYDTSEQSNQYVADLVAFNTSWGTEFGIVPLVKSPQTNPSFFNNLVSSHAVSADLSAATGGGTFGLWTATPGAGVSGQDNTAPGSATAPASVMQFGFGMVDFGGNYTGAVSGIAQYDVDAPSRLYVNRLQAMTNGSSISENRSQLGGISVDANGDTVIRADNFGVSGPAPIAGNNLFRVDFSARNPGVVNSVGATAADAGATGFFVAGSATTHSPSNLIPSDLTSNGQVWLAGSNFDVEYVYGDVGSVSGTGAHLDTSAGGDAGSDQRGTVARTRKFTLGSSVLTLGILSRDQGDATRAVNIWGVDATGAVVAGTPANLIVPTSGLTDNSDGFVLGYSGENTHYFSQAAFRGGVSQVALGTNAAGDTGLAAIQLADEISGPASDEWVNSIVAAKFDPANPTGTAEWAVVAYCNDAGGGGKAITDGAGNVVGQLVPLIDVGASALGPSMSPPAFDSAGNVWFTSSVELFKVDSMGNPFSDFDSALIRAVYDEATFSWELEKVLELGDTFTGANSGVPFTITFMGTADSDSISSGAFFSHNVVQDAFGGADAADFDTSDPRTNGGVIVNADILYDSNLDGMFDEAAGDEGYQVLLFVGNTTELPADACPADQNGDGFFNNTDINLFVGNFVAMNPAADINGDGNYNNTDINLFVNLFLTQCQ